MALDAAVDLARAAFDPLARRFGLQPRPSRGHPREVTLVYEDDTVRLRVVVEAGAEPSVMLGAKDGLMFGLAELGDVQVAGDDPAARFSALAALTEAYGAPILTGDLSSFDRLRRARAARVREDNQARFGTATGETPRFTGRPDLGELFADASNDGVVTARVYQGLWDYGYSREALARHLGEGVEDIQRRLDEWDRLR